MERIAAAAPEIAVVEVEAEAEARMGVGCWRLGGD